MLKAQESVWPDSLEQELATMLVQPAAKLADLLSIKSFQRPQRHLAQALSRLHPQLAWHFG